MAPSADTPAFEITANGKAQWLDDGQGPSQAQLAAFINTNREKLTSLTIAVQHGKTQPTLNFEDIGLLPSLESLTLGGVFVTALSFKTTNTPALRRLDICIISCSEKNGLRFELDLPQLRALEAQHIMVDGPCNFGLSLSRCPMLEQVTTYKFRYLSGDNFAILPNCKGLTLYRSECTDSLELLSAPKLELLSVEASYNLEHVRLWDLPNEITKNDVEQMTNELEEESKKIGEDLQKEADKWKNGTYTGRDAYERNWIEEEDVEDFDFKTSPFMNEILGNYLFRKFEKLRTIAKTEIHKRLLQKLAKRPVVHPKGSLPRCTINCKNMSLSDESREHLRSNKRVAVVGELADDDLF